MLDELKRNDFDVVIINGLAKGIDICALEAAARNDFRSVAVLGHGFDRIYPRAHADFARRIIDNGGCLISEFPSGTRPLPANFLQRNRIVAGLCDVAVIVEAPMRSGAMSTARQAFEADRQVVAFCPTQHGNNFDGCRALVDNDIAHPIRSIDDFLAAVEWRRP